MFSSTRITGALAALALLVVAPVAAFADTYTPGGDNQTFATSAGGWTQSTAFAGLCLVTQCIQTRQQGRHIAARHRHDT